MPIMVPDILPATPEIGAMCVAVVGNLHDVLDLLADRDCSLIRAV
jgi:hypothetical protein